MFLLRLPRVQEFGFVYFGNLNPFGFLNVSNGECGSINSLCKAVRKWNMHILLDTTKFGWKLACPASALSCLLYAALEYKTDALTCQNIFWQMFQKFQMNLWQKMLFLLISHLLHCNVFCISYTVLRILVNATGVPMSILCGHLTIYYSVYG